MLSNWRHRKTGTVHTILINQSATRSMNYIIPLCLFTWKTLAFKMSHHNYQSVSLTSHLFELKRQNTSVTCQSVNEASGDLCCGGGWRRFNCTTLQSCHVSLGTKIGDRKQVLVKKKKTISAKFYTPEYVTWPCEAKTYINSIFREVFHPPRSLFFNLSL